MKPTASKRPSSRLLGAGLALALTLTACGGGAPPAPAPPAELGEKSPGEVRLAVTSDLHWQSAGKAPQNQVVEQMSFSRQIVDALLEQAAAEGADALILCGDLTNDGRREEHRELAARLGEALAAGLPIYLVPGNHDFGEAPPAELAELYRDFGFGAAFSRDPASLSYAVRVREGLCLLMLDSCVYAGEGEAAPTGAVRPGTLLWLEGVLEETARRGDLVLTVSHHNLLDPSAGFLQKDYAMEGAEELLALLESHRVPLHLSGHRHSRQVARSGGAEWSLTELVSDMPIPYPNQTGMLTIRPGERTISYLPRTVDVAGWAARRGESDPHLLGFGDYSLEAFRRKTEAVARPAAAGLDAPQKDREVMAAYLGAVYEANTRGTLAERREELESARGYSLWQQYGGESIFRRWIPYLLDSASPDTQGFTISY